MLHCDFTNPPKDKYLLLAGLDPGPLFLIINSKITEFMRRRPDLSKCQVEIDHNDHPFLRHHSFIDCTEAYRIGLNEIYAQLEVTQEIQAEVIAAVKFSRTLASQHKISILEALR